MDGAEERPRAAVPFTLVTLAHSGTPGVKTFCSHVQAAELMWKGKVSVWTHLNKKANILSVFHGSKSEVHPIEEKGMGFLQVIHAVLCGGWKKRLMNAAQASAGTVEQDEKYHAAQI